MSALIWQEACRLCKNATLVLRIGTVCAAAGDGIRQGDIVDLGASADRPFLFDVDEGKDVYSSTPGSYKDLSCWMAETPTVGVSKLFEVECELRDIDDSVTTNFKLPPQVLDLVHVRGRRRTSPLCSLRQRRPRRTMRGRQSCSGHLLEIPGASCAVQPLTYLIGSKIKGMSVCHCCPAQKY